MSVFGLGKGSVKKKNTASVAAPKKSLFAWTKDVGDAIRGYKKTGQYLFLGNIIMGMGIVGIIFYTVLQRWIVPYGPWITLFVVLAGALVILGAMSFVGAHAFIHIRKKHILAEIEIEAKRQSMQLIVFNEPGYIHAGDRMIYVDGTQKVIDLAPVPQKEITGSLSRPSASLPAVIPLPAVSNAQASGNTIRKDDQQVTIPTSLLVQKSSAPPSIVPTPQNVADSIKLTDEEDALYDLANAPTLADQEKEVAQTHASIEEEEEDDLAKNFVYLPGTEKDNPRGNVLPSFPELKTFGEVLATGWYPTKSEIYLADSLTHGLIFRPIAELGHIGLFGRTGSGKGNLSRSLIIQALATGAEVYVADIHFMPIRLNRGTVEDWRPVMQKLPKITGIPNPAIKIEDIEALMNWFHALYQRLIEEGQTAPKVWKNRFLFLLEWPAIANRIGDDAVETLGFLLREIAKFNMHIVLESHGALVGTMGGNTDLRENYTSRFLLDENAKSCNALFGKPYDVRGLGSKGTTLLGTDKKTVYRGRVSFMRNEDMYAILDPGFADKLDDHDLSRFPEEDGEEKKPPTPPPPITSAAKPALKLVPTIDEAFAMPGNIDFIPDTLPKDVEYVPGIGNLPTSLIENVVLAASQVRARKHIQRLEIIPEGYRGGNKYYIIEAICNYKGLLTDEVKTDRIG